MTCVTIRCKDGYAKVCITGHAGYGYANGLPEGHDIVCSAISMLGQTLVQRMMDMSENKKIVLNMLKCNPGVISFAAIARNDSTEELENTLRTIGTGFQLLSIAQPDYVRGGCWIRGKESGIVYAWNSNDSRERPWKGETDEKNDQTEPENV